MPTKIEWCDETWNPVTGCSPVSEGCLNCYAARMAKRLAGRYGYAKENPFQVTFHEDKLELPMKWKKPRRIFVCSMGDLFHEDVDTHWIDDVLEVIGACPQHTFMMLTKRPENMDRKLYEVTEVHGCRELGGGDYLPNLWLGVTAENQARADERIPVLLSIPAAVHFVSVEPMLERVDLTSRLIASLRSRLAWVIAGPETPLRQGATARQAGPGARECRKEWIEDLAGQCEVAGVPFFDKRKIGWVRREWPRDNRTDGTDGTDRKRLEVGDERD